MLQKAPERRYKVVLHGFGNYANVYHHLIRMARDTGAPLDFAMILPTSHNLAIVREVLTDDQILDMESEVMKVGALKPDILANYHGNIHSDIDAEKRTFKHRKGDNQLGIALSVYKVYKDFLARQQPDHALFNHIEGFEQKMCASICSELGIPISVPVDCRTIGGSAMCADTHETLPEPDGDVSANMERAQALVTSFRERHLPAFNPLPLEVGGAPLPTMIRPFGVRFVDFIRRSLKDPGRFEWDFLNAAVLNNIPWYRDAWYGLKRRRARRWHDLKTLEELPEKFIYYPLHFSPESSINTPAPYFIDQMRVIDAIRHAMPSDHILVVKDHPAALFVRKKALMDRIRRSSGVQVIDPGASSRELMKRASITISVTGTATFEAFLLGRPSLTLGTMFASRYLGGIAPLKGLDQRIRHAIANPPTDAYIVRSVAEIMTIARPFTVFGLGYPGEPVFREGNIRNMLDALLGAVRARHRQQAD